MDLIQKIKDWWTSDEQVTLFSWKGETRVENGREITTTRIAFFEDITSQGKES